MAHALTVLRDSIRACPSCGLPRISLPIDQHPGEYLRVRFVEGDHLTVTAAAEKLGVARPALSQILNARAGISAAMALRLEKADWHTAEFWVDFQGRYELAQARRRAAEGILHKRNGEKS